MHKASVSFCFSPRVSTAKASLRTLVEVNGEQTVSDGVQTCVEEAKDKQHVSERMRDRLLHFFGEQPIPQAQQVVWSPADDERRHDDNAHLKSPHPRFGDVVVRAAEMHIPRQHYQGRKI